MSASENEKCSDDTTASSSIFRSSSESDVPSIPIDTPTHTTTNPPSKETVQESNDLYFFHLVKEMDEMGLQLPPIAKKEHVPEPRNSKSLRALAEQFVVSPQRKWVHEQAQSVDLKTLNAFTFQELLNGLFQEDGLTWERVLVLFYFCTDLSIRALQEKLIECYISIYNWTTGYITDTLACWVEQNGGWSKILDNSMDYMSSLLTLGTICLVVAAWVAYIRRSK